MNHLEKFLLYLEQTIQSSGGIQEKDKNQGLLSKDMEKENLNMRGYYSGELKFLNKPNVEQIKLKSGEYKRIERELEKSEENKTNPSLFSQVSIRINLGLKTKPQMRNDLLQVYDQLQDIKKDSELQDTYRKNLKVILRKFFTFGNIASRYVVLPLSATIPNDAMIRALNSSNNKGMDILNYTRQHREIITDAIDKDIKKYMTDNGYNFKNENDFYDNICYTKNNAKINLRDELAKIGANVKNIDSKKKILEKMPPDSSNRKPIEDEIRRLMEFKPDYLDRMEDVIESMDVETEEKNLKVMVLTWVPRQILTQSTGTIWTSCMSLSNYEDHDGGSNKKFVSTGITEGVFIAWLVNLADMKTIKEPIARILIKPFMDDEENIIWWPSTIYHDGGQGNELKLFEKTCRSYMLKKQKDLIKTDMTINIKDSKKVYSDREENKKIIFYKKEILSNELKDVVDFSPSKIIDYIRNGNYDILYRNQFFDVANYLISLNNVSLFKLFIDNFMLKLDKKTNNNKNYAIDIMDGIIYLFSKLGNTEKLEANETFYVIFFKKLMTKIPDFELSDSKNKEQIFGIAIYLAKRNRFNFINQLLESKENLIMDNDVAKNSAFVILNIMNGNKISFPLIAEKLKYESRIECLIFLYLYRGHKEVDNFFKTYFSDIDDKKIIDIIKENGEQGTIRQLKYVVKFIDEHKNLKNINYGLFDCLVKTKLIDNIKTVDDFFYIFDKDFSFIDEKLTESIIEKNIFKNIFKEYNRNSDSLFRYLLESLVLNGNKKLITNFIENSIDNYNNIINNVLYDCYEYSYHKNIDIFNEVILLILKKDSNSVRFDSLLNYTIMIGQHLSANKIENEAFEMLINNIDTEHDNYAVYNVYILLEGIGYNKNKIFDFAKRNKINLDKLKENLHKLFSDGTITNFFRCPLLNMDKVLKLFEEIEFFKNRNDSLLALSSISDNIKIKILNIVFDKYRDTLDNEKIEKIYYNFFNKKFELNEEEIKIHKRLKEIIKQNPKLGNIEITSDVLHKFDSQYSNYELFLTKMLYEKLEDFLKSDLFKKIVSKSNTITKRKKNPNRGDYRFISSIPKFLYKTKIDEKMIPTPVLKMIKENKYLSAELEVAKKN